MRRLIAGLDAPPPSLARRRAARLTGLARRHREALRRVAAGRDYFAGEPAAAAATPPPLAAAEAAERRARAELERAVRAAVADPDGRCALVADGRLHDFGPLGDDGEDAADLAAPLPAGNLIDLDAALMPPPRPRRKPAAC
ncbi:MAG TPA: hypothetical protein VG406_01790 [Isosphaeraceae bacterium]|nr:hypothetical protein [Isosphaeraceae bacterium]